jgi:hypothetical protein
MSRGRRIVRAGGIFACSVFALLLWSKLKLVSGIPRTAFATPEAAGAPDAEPRVAGPSHKKSPAGEAPAGAPEAGSRP